MNTAGLRSMRFERASLGDRSGDRQHRAVYAYPDLALLRDDQIVGDREGRVRCMGAIAISMELSERQAGENPPFRFARHEEA